MQWPTSERRKPIKDHKIITGTLFEMADEVIAFVLDKLEKWIGARDSGVGAVAPTGFDIPRAVVLEAIVNAIAHRNYASIGSIQVEVYSDRVEVISPGRLHRAISVADLYKKHESFAINPRIARAMYQVKYIETLGTGLTDMLAECEAKGLKEPLFEECSGRFRVVIWRKNLFVDRGDNMFLGLPEEQRRICEMLIANPRMSVRGIAAALNVRPRTVEKQIAALKVKNVVVREGGTRGYWRVILGAV